MPSAPPHMAFQRTRRPRKRRGGRITLAMDLQFTAVYEKVPNGFIALVEELPDATRRVELLEEARSNLEEAIPLVLEVSEDCTRSINRLEDHYHE